MGWLFNLHSDGMLLIYAVLSYFGGWLLFRGGQYKKLGIYWLVWTVILTYIFAFHKIVVRGHRPIGVTALILSVAETLVTYRLLSDKLPAGKGRAGKVATADHL
jgi:hypothetical protein